MSEAALDKIKDLNTAYRAITGDDAYLYTSQPASVALFTFATAARPFNNSGEALAHMVNVLDKARSGWTHNEIIYGKPRDPFPNAHTVNRGAW